MIVIDASEKREGTRMPNVPGSVTSTILEEFTGADIMVSPVSYPPKSEMLISKHLENGAILIQRKSGRDLVNSVGPRLNTSLAKMLEVNTKYSGQRILLVTGMFMSDADGNCIVGEFMTPKSQNPYIDWKNTNRPYSAVRTAFQMWNIRGGISTYTVMWDGEIPYWLIALEENLIKATENEFKEIIELAEFPDDPPEQGDVLQLPRRVRDFRRVLIAHENVGVKTANALWEYTHGCPIGCIEILTGSTFDGSKLSGIGKRTVERNRELWGLGDSMKIGVFYPGDLVSEDFPDGAEEDDE